MNAMINISVDRDAVVATGGVVMQILNARADQKTIRVALEVFGKSVSIGPSSITGCSFENTESPATEETDD